MCSNARDKDTCFGHMYVKVTTRYLETAIRPFDAHLKGHGRNKRHQHLGTV